MLTLIELLVIAQLHQTQQPDQETMFNLIKKAVHWLNEQGNISAPSYTCDSALLMGY